MRFPLSRLVAFAAVSLALTQAGAAFAADAETDALDLESAPEAPPAKAAKGGKFFVEGAVGTAGQRDGSGRRDIGRVSLDWKYNASIAPGLRATISDRLDNFHPKEEGSDASVNSLREAYLSWQLRDDKTLLELGRINLRNGPAYGYNPTDFFRDGTLRVLTTANPFSLRENRLGSVMLRAQHLWAGGSVALAYSPKLANKPSDDGWSLDLGSTNNRDRTLLTLGTRWSETVNSQVLLYKQDGLSPTLGANLTALVSDAVVMHLEGSHGKEPDLMSKALGGPSNEATRSRFAGGLTYTTKSKLSLTAEYQYNGFAASPAAWNALAATSQAGLGAYIVDSIRQQELASRQAYLLYVTQKDLGIKDLDLTAMLRVNGEDHSRLSWMELRRHWTQFDLAVQVQHHHGRRNSEFGSFPDRYIWQVLGIFYF